MSEIPINLGIEDELSEAVLRRLLADSRRGYFVGTAYRRGGFGYLRRTTIGWNRAARGVPFVVLTDLDDYDCPRSLVDEWLTEPKHPNLLFRVAVREVEAWLLADGKHLAPYLGIREALIPDNPDSLIDPKATLIDLARKSRSGDVKARIVPKRGSTARQGPDYNGCLIRFVSKDWQIAAAVARSPSLARAVDRLKAFKPVWD
jgi:hypothetical protein